MNWVRWGDPFYTLLTIQTEDVSETDVLVPTFSPSVMMDKY